MRNNNVGNKMLHNYMFSIFSPFSLNSSQPLAQNVDCKKANDAVLSTVQSNKQQTIICLGRFTDCGNSKERACRH